jgi:toxin ParE1/3/4
LLADNPRLGRPRPEIAPEARGWIVGRYLVLYRAQDDGIEVVRVVHGAREIEQIEF